MIIPVNEIYLILNYIITAIISVVIALGLGLPLLPRKPIRFSYDKSAMYPTPVFALGILAMCFAINFYWIYNGIVLSLLCGIFSALFVKYGFDYIFPEFIPVDGENKDNVDNSQDTNLKTRGSR